MEFSDIYNKILEINPDLKNRIESKTEDFCTINFHEYLTIGFSAAHVDINHGFTHGHFDDDDDYEWFFDLIRGDIVFVEDVRKFSLKTFLLFGPWNLKIMTKKKFEEKKTLLMGKKYLRIYTTNEIIKRNTK